jgi:hypothetical protein
MIVIDKDTPGGDEAVIADSNPSLDVEFDASAYEDAIPDDNAGSRFPIPIKLKIDIRLKNTSFTDH